MTARLPSSTGWRERRRHVHLPGGTKGVVQSNLFSLDGYSAADEPVIYFNYFLETDGVDATGANDDGGDQDSLRVYVVTSDGAQHLVASNNTARELGFFDDEFDDPPQVGQYDDNIDIDVQQLFDSTGSWRQARVPIGSFSGQEGLSLRVESLHRRHHRNGVLNVTNGGWEGFG